MSKLSIVACWHTSEYGYGYGKVERLTRHILGHFGDGGVTEASARIVATVSAEASSPVQPHSVCSGELCCATTVDNSGVYVCYLKGLVSVYFRCPSRTVGFSGTRLSLCIYNQPTKLSDAQALPTSWLGGSTRGLQPGGHCTRRLSICYPYSRHPLQAQAPLNLSVMACHSLERIQADPLCLSENLIS